MDKLLLALKQKVWLPTKIIPTAEQAFYTQERARFREALKS